MAFFKNLLSFIIANFKIQYNIFYKKRIYLYKNFITKMGVYYIFFIFRQIIYNTANPLNNLFYSVAVLSLLLYNFHLPPKMHRLL